MKTLLLTINLFPDFAIVAAGVVLAHWFWLFGLKNKMKVASAKKAGSNGFMEPSKLSDTQNDSQITSSSSINGGYTSSIEKNHTSREVTAPLSRIPEHLLEEGYTRSEAGPSRETLLIDKYADFDMVATLEALKEGTLTVERKRELEELALLTLSTEKNYPNPLDIDFKGIPPVKEYAK